MAVKTAAEVWVPKKLTPQRQFWPESAPQQQFCPLRGGQPSGVFFPDLGEHLTGRSNARRRPRDILEMH